MILRWMWRASCSVASGAGAGAPLLEERVTAQGRNKQMILKDEVWAREEVQLK